MIGGAADTDSPSSTASNSSGSDSSEEETAEAPQAAPAKIGDTVTDKDLAFTVTNVTTAKTLGNSFTSTDAQGTFHVITIKIENQAKETKTIDSSMLQIKDSEGRTFDRSIEGQSSKGLSEGKVDLFLQQVQPGLSVTGEIVFDLPDNVADPRLLVKGSLFSSGKEIRLTN